ncbi:MAG: hypothetical protein QOD44_3216 [Solirubrobacteraceae bacterium]|jgi:hypothetical protein|nr:hypothetical protein [Solirubrobacteraceae bacterium]
MTQSRWQRGPVLVLAGAVVLLVGILAIAIADALRSPGPGGEAAALVPASALAFVRLSTDPDDAAAQRLSALAPRIPGYLSLRDAALTAVSPAPGAFDPRRDVRPWLGDEAAVALVDVGGGRFGSIVLAQVRSRPRAEALLQRVAGPGRGVRYRGLVLRRFGANAAVFARGFLIAGPEAAVREAVDVAQGEAPALADAPRFEAALEGARRPAEAYLSPRGLRGFVRPLGGVAGAVAALIDDPELRGVGASLRADRRGLRVHARRMGAAGAELRPRLLDGVPAGAVATLAGPSFAAAVQAAQRAGAGAALETVRTTVRKASSIDLDRDLLGRLRGEYTAWLEPGAAAPVVTLAARTSDPGGLREVLARLQNPLTRALAGGRASTPSFEARTIAGADAFTLDISDRFAPTYAVTGDTVVVSTSAAGVERFRARTPRLRATPGFRAAVPRVPARIESLGFVDVRQLLALGEQTGLTADVLGPVRAAAAIIEREKDDTTAELSFEIP